MDQQQKDALCQRLDRLDRGNRWWRGVGVGAVAVLSLVLLTGCDDVNSFISGIISGVTLTVFDKCIAQSSESLSEDTKRFFCLKKHAKRVYIETGSGASYKDHKFMKTKRFSGIVINKSDEYVLTGMTINIEHPDNKDDNGKKITEICKIENVWIKPKKTGSFTCQDLKFFPRDGRLYDKEDKPLWEWSMSDTFGIKINL